MAISNLLKGFNYVDGSNPADCLGYHKNCAALAFAKILGISWQKAVNLFIAQKWIGNAKGLQFEEAIEKVLNGLDFKLQVKNQTWGIIKPKLKTYPAGGYFAVNTQGHDFGGKGTGHAVAIKINKTGGWSMDANNADYNKKKGTYLQNIVKSSHKFSIWGPA